MAGKMSGGNCRLERAIDIFPRYFMALERLGIEYAKRQQYEPASSVLNKAVAINSHADQSLYWLGISQYKLGQTSAAIETLRRAVAASPVRLTHTWDWELLCTRMASTTKPKQILSRLTSRAEGASRWCTCISRNCTAKQSTTEKRQMN
jgi:tetratricopeptide (TPR) repeat protein